MKSSSQREGNERRDLDLNRVENSKKSFDRERSRAFFLRSSSLRGSRREIIEIARSRSAKPAIEREISRSR